MHFWKGVCICLSFIFCAMLRIYLQICRRNRWRKREIQYPNEEEDTRLDVIRDKHWRDVADYGNDKKKIHDLR